jgi:hypothetical protein
LEFVTARDGFAEFDVAMEGMEQYNVVSAVRDCIVGHLHAIAMALRERSFPALIFEDSTVPVLSEGGSCFLGHRDCHPSGMPGSVCTSEPHLLTQSMGHWSPGGQGSRKMGSKAIYLHTRQSAKSLMGELLNKVMDGKAEQVDAMYLKSTVLKENLAPKALFATDPDAPSLIAVDDNSLGGTRGN